MPSPSLQDRFNHACVANIPAGQGQRGMRKAHQCRIWAGHACAACAGGIRNTTCLVFQKVFQNKRRRDMQTAHQCRIWAGHACATCASGSRYANYLVSQKRWWRGMQKARQSRMEAGNAYAARASGSKNTSCLFQQKQMEACKKLECLLGISLSLFTRCCANYTSSSAQAHSHVPPQVLTDLVRGLADAAGFVPYRELARAMVRRTQEKQRRDSVRRPASSLAKQHSQQQQPQQPSNHTPPTAGAVVSAPELLPQHAITKSSTPL
eukprot:scaffold73227_cov14-Tisochrysis_lutea.AAC.1